MEPNIPVGSEAGVASGMQRAVAGAEREQREGASGKWVAHWKMVHIVRPVWETDRRGQPAGPRVPAADLYPRGSPTACGGSSRRRGPSAARRDLLSVALQYGNAFGQGLQAAALKPADSFGNDDVLYLMEDMATGEIRLSILWEWLHKHAALTAADEGSGRGAGDPFTPGDLPRPAGRGVRETAPRRQPRRPRSVENDDAADRARDRRDLRHAARSSCPGTSTCSTSIWTARTSTRPGGGFGCSPRRSAATARASPRTSTSNAATDAAGRGSASRVTNRRSGDERSAPGGRTAGGREWRQPSSSDRNASVPAGPVSVSQTGPPSGSTVSTKRRKRQHWRSASMTREIEARTPLSAGKRSRIPAAIASRLYGLLQQSVQHLRAPPLQVGGAERARDRHFAHGSEYPPTGRREQVHGADAPRDRGSAPGHPPDASDGGPSRVPGTSARPPRVVIAEPRGVAV